MIRSVSMKNWKRHEELHLTFNDGINFLVGPNGVGKTSVLDAICFGLLGDIKATPMYTDLTYRDLMRDAETDLEITLTFSPPLGGVYTLTRTHSARTNRKRGSLLLNGTAVTGRWDQATQEVLRLLDTSDPFLRRVILLSEGDTFAYSTRPPGEGLTKHIEGVLGIDRMEDLRSDLAKLRREFAGAVAEQGAELKALRRATDEDRTRARELRDQLARLRSERDAILGEVDELNKELGARTSDVQRVEQLIAQARSLVDDWAASFGEIPRDCEYLVAIEPLRGSLGRERADLVAQRDSLRDELAWMAAGIDSQRRIVELVEPLEVGEAEVACPICKRPLTAEIVRAIRQESLSLIAELEGRKREKKAQLPVTEMRIGETGQKLQQLLSIESKVRVALEYEPKSLSIPVLESYRAELAERHDAIRNQARQFRLQAEEKAKLERTVNEELTELSERIDEDPRLERMRSLAGVTKAQFVSSAFLESVETAVAQQRSALLGPLTEELSTMWSAFLGTDVAVSLTPDAQIVIEDKSRKTELKFPQLSGGEKTALLIFTQVLLCRSFSDADFMMIDEPLEHLDARNRWALLKYLVDTTTSGFVKQLIVTTIEEPLVREYLDEYRVSVTHLSRGQTALGDV